MQWHCDIDGCSRPCHGQVRSGDLWLMQTTAKGRRVVVLDVTGHGQPAADIADRLLAAMVATEHMTPVSLLTFLSLTARGTDGAAAGVLDLELAQGKGTWTGVGNVVLRVITNNPVEVTQPNSSPLSQPGALGTFFPSLRTVQFPLQDKQLLVIGTDGVASTGLFRIEPADAILHPRLLAERVVRDFGRAYDDATCVVAQVRDPVLVTAS
jgi:negative regulator of sigma-B (phosphoserine phosphatase)